MNACNQDKFWDLGIGVPHDVQTRTQLALPVWKIFKDATKMHDCLTLGRQESCWLSWAHRFKRQGYSFNWFKILLRHQAWTNSLDFSNQHKHTIEIPSTKTLWGAQHNNRVTLHTILIEVAGTINILFTIKTFLAYLKEKPSNLQLHSIAML